MGTLDINWDTITPEQLLEITRSLSVSAGHGACVFFQGNEVHLLLGMGKETLASGHHWQGAETAIRPPACRENPSGPGKGIPPPVRNGAPQTGRSGKNAGLRPTRRAGSARRWRGGRRPGALAPGWS